MAANRALYDSLGGIAPIEHRIWWRACKSGSIASDRISTVEQRIAVPESATFRENENGTPTARLAEFEDHQVKSSDALGVKRIIQAQIQPILLDT